MEFRQQNDGPKKSHPKDSTNFLSRFLFCWQIKILIRKWKNKLGEEEFKTPPQAIKATLLANRLERNWHEEISAKNPSLLRALLRTFGLEFVFYGLFCFIMEILSSVSQPILLQKFLQFFSKKQKETITKEEAFLYGFGIVATTLIRVLMFHLYFLQISIIGVKMRIACSSLVYGAMLNFKKNTIQKTTLGHIVNLLSNDVDRFEKVLPFLHYIWISPINILLAMYTIVSLFDYTAMAGIVVIILFSAFQRYFYTKLSSARMAVSLETDYRIRLMGDIINGIQAVKMYTWEQPFNKALHVVRKSELSKITKAVFFRTFNNTYITYVHQISCFLFFLTVVCCGLPLTAQYVFAVTVIYNTLFSKTFIAWTKGVIQFGEVKITIRRIQNFLLIDHLQTNRFMFLPDLQKENVGVFIQKISVKWNSSLPNNVLSDINFNTTSEDLVAIVGSAGSGKSTLLQVMLNEIEVKKGIMKVEGSISYAPQEPWIFPATVRQNMLFGQEMDEKRYLQVIRVCALERDIHLFPYGDNSLVGERGVMLSGGQKSRINLARAVYRNADIYLLDDPLSAVDTNVANYIFKECFLGFLKTKCVIFVTHQLRFLENMSKIYFLDKGKMKKGKPMVNVLNDRKNTEPDVIEQTVEMKKSSLISETKEDMGNDANFFWKSYFLSGNSIISYCFLTLLFIAFQLICSFVNRFLAAWVDSKENLSDFPSDKISLCIYGILLMVAVFTVHIAFWLLLNFCRNSSKQLHDCFFAKLLSGSMNFFNKHPSGRILNRFANDIGIIDENIPESLTAILRIVLNMGIAILVIVITNYWIILPTLILYLVFYFLRRSFQPTITYLRRIESTRRSPIYTYLSASVEGLTVIKAFDSQKLLQREFNLCQDVHTSADYLHKALHCALGFWTDIFCVIYICAIVFTFLFSDGINYYAGNVGLAITQSLLLVTNVQYAMKTLSELDSQMTSVRRVTNYRDLTPELHEGIDDPPKMWPNKGEIVFDSVSMRYSPDTSLVLNHISLTIQAGEKIGIIGRTGSGKTSLISILFRLFDFEGTVSIDGINTKSVPLKLLRSKILIIPQEPFLFLGSLRKNLDPFDEFGDSQLWSALEEVHLKEVVSGLPSGLEFLVTEGGSNFSVGQKQMLCLVRAILRDAKIVVLDEATANIDVQTDTLIQSVIKKRFKNCTVLTVAHRINTVMDSDKILAVDSGSVIEFGAPEELQLDRNSYFYNVVQMNLMKE